MERIYVHIRMEDMEVKLQGTPEALDAFLTSSRIKLRYLIDTECGCDFYCLTPVPAETTDAT